ncbi:MAG: plastocyanin/azurin family copper-binding protein, partial [Nitrosopumilaceae archaeon]|nr:plastocyanin/azurin family copper-binding protein [Nitrosopumilaceae archaeon]
ECYLPPSVSVNVGDTVSWDNVDTAAHTVTSGTPADGPDGEFDSSLLMGGKTFEVTFDTAGSYDYFCMVHPWMIGDVQVS